MTQSTVSWPCIRHDTTRHDTAGTFGRSRDCLSTMQPCVRTHARTHARHGTHAPIHPLTAHAARTLRRDGRIYGVAVCLQRPSARRLQLLGRCCGSATVRGRRTRPRKRSGPSAALSSPLTVQRPSCTRVCEASSNPRQLPRSWHRPGTVTPWVLVARSVSGCRGGHSCEHRPPRCHRLRRCRRCLAAHRTGSSAWPRCPAAAVAAAATRTLTMRNGTCLSLIHI